MSSGECAAELSEQSVSVIAEAALPNYQSEVLHLSVGASVSIEGVVQSSPAKGQPTEVRASRVLVHGSLLVAGGKSSCFSYTVLLAYGVRA